MMIKGSLLGSVPNVKRFRAKICPKWAKNWWFWRENILTLTISSARKSIPTETRYLAQKNGVDPL